MRKLLYLLYLFPCLLFGQNRTADSLKLALKNAKHDTTKCNILSVMIEEENDDKVWSVYNEQLLKLAKKNAYSSSTSLNLFFLKHLADAFHNIGFLAQQHGDISIAIDYYNRSMKIQKKINGKERIANSLDAIGIIYLQQGDIPKSLESFHRSLKIMEEINNKEGIAYSLHNIANIYSDQVDIPKALEYHHKSLKIREDIKDKKGISSSLSSIGALYQHQNNNFIALKYLLTALKIREEIKDMIGIASSLNNIGVIYSNQGAIKPRGAFGRDSLLSKAIDYYQRSLKIREEINDKVGIATSLNTIADAMLQKDEVMNALPFAKRSFITAKELGFPYILKNSAYMLKLIFQKQNKYKEAFEMYELEIKMRDSINNQETQKAAVKKQMQYTYEKKAALDSTAHAKENDIKNAEITARKAELKVKQNTQYALYGGLALVLIFAGFMFNRFKVTQKQKHIIEIKEKETQQQKHIIEEKHKEITDSINYAERIQRSFIATKEMLDENLDRRSVAEALEAIDNYFVLFKPKDVVSGDFYWAHKLNNGNFALATADSTGHGVPGAIMSLLNITSLEKAIETLTEPADILNATRKTIIERLKKDGSEHGGKDGMDASLCVFDFKNKKLIVAAANNPVWIVRRAPFSLGEGRGDEAEVIEIKPDKMPVGKHDRDNVSFTQQTIDLQSGDVVYTLTDGFPDQFGGEKGKKFMSKNLKELLSANSHLPMHEQKQLLEKTFANWVGDLEQVDDVTLIGVRI